MNATELRISNYLAKHKGGYRVVKVFTDTYYTDTEGMSTLFRDAKPIPLKRGDDKWMKRFGFEKETANWIIGVSTTNNHLGQFEVQLTEKGFWVILNWNYSGKRKKLNIGHYEFVHQLQNIYFVIICKELIC